MPVSRRQFLQLTGVALLNVGVPFPTLPARAQSFGRTLLAAPVRSAPHDDASVIAHLWPDSDRAAANDVKQYIHLLRNKLYRSGDIGDPIENIKGFGYRLNS